MTEAELKARLKAFGLRVIRLVDALPRGRAGNVIGRQLMRAGLSVGANYHAACRAKSAADFAAKMAIVEEEADESCYWLEVIADAGLLKPGRLAELRREAGEIVAITVASIQTARRSIQLRSRSGNPESKIQNPELD